MEDPTPDQLLSLSRSMNPKLERRLGARQILIGWSVFSQTVWLML